MKDSIVLQDKTFISAKRASKLMNYAQDYIGQLCRSGKLECTMVGRSWFVTEASLYAHRENAIDGTQERISRSTKFVKSLPKTAKESVIDQKDKKASVSISVSIPVSIQSTQTGKVVENTLPNTSSTSEEKREFKIEIPKQAPIISPIQTLKYEQDNRPLLPELKKSVPSIFALPKNSSNILAVSLIPSVGEERSRVQNVRQVPVRISSTPTSVTVRTSVTDVPSSNVSNSKLSRTFATTTPRSTIALPMVSGIAHANQFTTFAVTLLALGGFFFTLSIATFQNTRSVTYNQASVSGAVTELVSEVMKAIGLRGRTPSTIVKAPATVQDNSVDAGELNGIGIFPATNPTEDELAKARIINSFSDEIQIRPDQSGAAGIITPVFKKTDGNDFVYVMVPVKEKKQLEQ